MEEVRWQGGWLAGNCVACLLVGCCGWVVNQDGVCIEVCWGTACNGSLPRGHATLDDGQMVTGGSVNRVGIGWAGS